MDVEIREIQSSSGQTDLCYFLQYLEISVHCSKLAVGSIDFQTSSNASALAAGIETCILNLNSNGRRKKISTIYQDHDLARAETISGYFYFKAHDFESLNKILFRMRSDIKFRIYLLCHNLFDLLAEYKKILQVGVDPSRVTFVFSKFNQSLSFHSDHKLKNVIEEIKYNEVFYLSPQRKIKIPDSADQKKWTPIFYGVIKTAQFVLEPVKNIGLLMQKSNMIWLLRCKELIDFSLNLIGHFYQVMRLIFIKIYYFFRHKILMTFYKMYGIIIDTYYLAKHFLNILIRFFFYPVFKMYWFGSYQYKKRVKKSIRK